MTHTNSQKLLPLERLLAGQNRALELAVAGAPLADVLGQLVLALEGFDGDLNGSILLMDGDGRHLRHGAAPSLPDAFNRAVDAMPVGPGVGACGTAAFTRRPVIVEDLQHDPLWAEYRDVAIRHGLRSCWSTPILSRSGDVLGTFAAYAHQRRYPSPAERDTVEVLAHTAGLVIEGERSREALATTHERYRDRNLSRQSRDRFLVGLDDALRPLDDPNEITRTAATALAECLGVDRCAYFEVDEDEDSARLTGNHTHGRPRIAGDHRFGDFGEECLRLLRAGAPFTVTDSETDPRIGAEYIGVYRAAAIGALICVPVRKAGRLAAAMAVHTIGPREWRDREIELVQQVATRCWEPIERVRLTRTLRETVERERRAREETDAQRRRAESANRAKDEFLAMLGHELRNPLSPIRTALELMKLREPDAVSPERTVIERQVGHLTRLVDDLLDVSRIARGEVDLRFEPVDAADVVARAVELASPLLEERGHHLVIDLPPEPLMVMGDPPRLVQVLSNLLTNAAKYTDPAGTVTVRTRSEGHEVVVSVADTGRGIVPETLPRVFDLFVQERQGSDRAQGGLGLGLAIVRSFVERHGGRVEASSAGTGKGSEFTVRLPPHQMATTATGARHVDVPVPRRGHKRVLVVDDNADGAAMLAAVLGARGHEVRVAHDGPTALEVARTFRPDSALLDIGLPLMDGYELAVKLRQEAGLYDLMLVAVTGYGQAVDRARSRAAGFNHHLVKPVDLAAVDSVLGHGARG